MDTELPLQSELRRIKPTGKIYRHIILWLIVLFVLMVLFFVYIQQPPSNFPVKELIEVGKGVTTNTLVSDFSNAHLIKSQRLFKYFIIFLSRGKGAIAGDYYFTKALSAWDLALRITRGQYEVPYIRVTYPEGSDLKQIAKISTSFLPEFNTEEFLSLTKNQEGYLFPDTYYFLPNAKAQDVVTFMESDFQRKIALIKTEIANFGKPIDQVMTMASLLEEEGRTSDTRKIIAGILWKRLSLGMPLQVDSTFLYINGKNTYNLTSSDLQINSPYNTYKYKGLPPTPITNPGMDSVEAALHPTVTPYLYYLSDPSGGMHYATTFTQHVANKLLYLK
jgi:UPF0755 protein